MQSGLSRAGGGGGIAALLCCAGACVDLLDVPDDPRLIEGVKAPAGEAGAASGVSGGGGGDRPTGAGAAAADVGAPPLPTQGGGPAQSGEVAPDAPDAAPVEAGKADADILAAPEAGVRDADAAPCGAGESLGPNGNCFAFIATLLDWESARQGCRGRGEGWDLATARSSEVNGFMAGLSDQEGWMGASDASTEGAWIWISDRAPFWDGDGLSGSAVGGAYENWNSDEPNGEESSDCARLVPTAAGAWGDLECEELRGSFCEGPTR